MLELGLAFGLLLGVSEGDSESELLCLVARIKVRVRV